MPLFKVLVLTVLLFASASVHSQDIPFTNVNPFIGDIPLIYENFFGSGVSFFDVDEDGWDDLTFCTDSADTRYYRNVMGQFVFTYNFKNTKNSKSCVWGDINEDGFNDLLVSRYDAEPQLFLGAMGNTFQEVFIGLDNAFMPNDGSTGLALGDLNRDGFLDVAISNYSYFTPNRIYLNENGLNFNPINLPIINNNTNPSFQPVWIDIDGDLFPELYIVNDHQFNNELYSFNQVDVTETAVEHNLVFPADAMSNSWEDFDKDGDMDLYISNSPNLPNYISANDGNGYFLDVSSSQPLSFNLESWSGLWIDENNDSWSDLFICTRGGDPSLGILNNKYFRNQNGHLSEFQCVELTNIPSGYYASAKGDFNNDGLSDLVITPESNGSVSALENAMNHFVYQNTSNSTNRYFKFRLNGRLSNRNGFGTKYTAYFDSSLVSGYTMSSGNYLCQNSQNIILGLGQSLAIDSLVLNWPSGIVDKYYNLNSNQFQLLTEAETMTGIQTSQGACPGDPANASLLNWPSVIWSNNETSQTTTFNTPTITASVGTGFGHRIDLNAMLPEPPSAPQIILSTSPSICINQNSGSASIALINAAGETISQFLFDTLAPGTYHYPLTYNSTCNAAVDFTIDLIDSTTVHWNIENFICPDSAFIFNPTIIPSTAPITWNSISPGAQLQAGVFGVSALTLNGCAIDTLFEIAEVVPPTINSTINSAFPNSELVLSISGNFGPYSCVWSDGSAGLSFFWTDSVQTFATITDEFGCAYTSSFSLNKIEDLENSILWKANNEGIYFIGTEVLLNVSLYNELGQLVFKCPYLLPFSTISLDRKGLFIIHSEKNNWKISK